jgi:hypothetical protein
MAVPSKLIATCAEDPTPIEPLLKPSVTRALLIAQAEIELAAVRRDTSGAPN